MDVTIIAEANEDGIHPVTAQMVTAAVKIELHQQFFAGVG